MLETGAFAFDAGAFVQLAGFVVGFLLLGFGVFLLCTLGGGGAELAGVFALALFFGCLAGAAAAAERERGDRYEHRERA